MTTHDTDPVNERRTDTSADDRTDFDSTEGDRADLDGSDVDRTDTDADNTDADRQAGGLDSDEGTADATRADTGVPDSTVAGSMGTSSTDADDTARGDQSVGGMDSGRDLSADEHLVPQQEAVDFKARWEVIQQGFVDDPRNSVTEADKLVDDVLKRLAASFDEQHQELEKQWSDGEPSTEDLRSALQKYRSFFQRLLTL
ncbi:hypothetical protein EV643_12348 [Kribbella sp. VKM Ac-2527]|uniref:Uncharacterized protein n=1 Tax=Kribbella caucasensis TaxID=2512215 RepID=A0A4R6JHP2_9ACTN|nr:hypothetical protein [Kribbella sp. VKM Ac-2527]TDO35242.1 hypothetical protein EV643_12348 [Kribbella sp. VKM Ac-2527]